MEEGTKGSEEGQARPAADLMNSATIRIGVLAAVDPTVWVSDAVAAVIRSQLRVRRDDIELDFRTVVAAEHPRRSSSWRPASTSPWAPSVQAVIVDESIDTAGRSGAGISDGVVVIDTSMFATTTALCSLFATTTDATALDTRRRMLAHLGILTSPGGTDDVGAFERAADVFSGSLTVTDRLLIAQAVGVEALADDPYTAALVTQGSDTDGEAFREFDRIIAELSDLEPTAARRTAGLQQRVAELESEVDRLHDLVMSTDRRAIERLDAAAARERSLVDRLETALLRSELIDD
jgi:hypothetical protein